MLLSLPSWDYFQCKSLLLECAVLIMTQKLLWLLLWGMISFCSNAQRNVLLPNCCSRQLICLFCQCQVKWGIPVLVFIFLGSWSRQSEGHGSGWMREGTCSPSELSNPLCPSPGDMGVSPPWGARLEAFLLLTLLSFSLGLGPEAPLGLGPSWEWGGSILGLFELIPFILLSQEFWLPTPSGKCSQHPSTLGGVGWNLFLTLKRNLFSVYHFFYQDLRKPWLISAAHISVSPCHWPAQPFWWDIPHDHIMCIISILFLFSSLMKEK